MLTPIFICILSVGDAVTICAMRIIRKVVVGVSGGVDSAVTALMLKAKGYNVIGVFMKNWDIIDETGQCTVSQDEIDAQMVCEQLRIQFQCVNFVKEYWNDVFTFFLNDYLNGYTPNPDILCNRNIKFKSFFNYARDCLNADAIATGHYARTSYGDYLENYKKSSKVRLLKAGDSFKDQTFFLSQVNQEPLQRTMFPLGNLCKNYVKKIAIDAGMMNLVKKKESTGICFVGSRKFQNFVSEYIEDHTGVFVDIENGYVVGKHTGVHNWTIGQRCRLHGFKSAYFVVKKDVASQTIFVAAGGNHPALFTQFFIAKDIHWIHSPPVDLSYFGILRCTFRFQHTKPLLGCKVVLLSTDKICVQLDVPLRAVTPGQYAVFYSEQECLGSARISFVGPSLFSLNEEVCEGGLLYSDN